MVDGGVFVGVSDSVDSGSMSQLNSWVAVLVGHGESQEGDDSNESLKSNIFSGKIQMFFCWCKYLHVVADLLVLIQVMPTVGCCGLLYHSPPSSNSFSLGLFKRCVNVRMAGVRVRKPVTVVNDSKLRSVTVVKTCVTTDCCVSSTWPKCQRYTDVRGSSLTNSLHVLYDSIHMHTYWEQLGRIWHDNFYFDCKMQ